MSSLPAIVEFLDQDYRYRSVAIQITRDAGLAPIRQAGMEPKTAACLFATMADISYLGILNLNAIFIGF